MIENSDTEAWFFEFFLDRQHLGLSLGPAIPMGWSIQKDTGGVSTQVSQPEYQTQPVFDLP
jgi:hypothetical protein